MNVRVNQPTPPVEYPDSDGRPMADNTKQYEWITTIEGNLSDLFRDRPDVFVAGDHLIYAKEGDPKVRQAPDVYVAFGRPKGHRGSYKVWEEGGVFPQVVFEVLSPGNRPREMARKRRFYRAHGAEEYYVYDPDTNRLTGWRRAAGRLRQVPAMNGFVSPRLGVTFDLSGPVLVLRRPDGQPFLTSLEVRARERAERQRAEAERQRAEQEARRVEAERDRADKLAAKLRELGVDPDAV